MSPDVRERLTSEMKARPATTSPVSSVPPAQETPPASLAVATERKPETYRCVLGSTKPDHSVVTVWAERELEAGEKYQVVVDDTDYANAVVVRTLVRKDNLVIVQMDVTRPFPTKPTNMVLVRMGASSGETAIVKR